MREGAPREGTHRGALGNLSPPLTPSPPLCSHPAWLLMFLDPAPLGVREPQWDSCLDRWALGAVAQLLPGREGEPAQRLRAQTMPGQGQGKGRAISYRRRRCHKSPQ